VPVTPAVEVVNGRQLRKQLADIGEEATEDLRLANLEGVDQVLEEALKRVPVKTGRLKATIRGSATKTRGTVRAGTARLRYALPIHFGWAARNIEPNTFLYDALDDRREEVLFAYERQIDNIVKKHL